MSGTIGTTLKDRVLWFDGDSSFKPQALYDFILSGKELNSNIFVTELSQDIIQFNRMVPDKSLSIKTELKEITPEWIIPDKYKNIDLTKFLLTKLLAEIDENEFYREDIDERLSRVHTELDLYRKYGLEDILKVIIYIVDVFVENDIVWGTGRGSSCCSYCLYLIGLHDVDSVEYELDLTEFFR